MQDQTTTSTQAFKFDDDVLKGLEVPKKASAETPAPKKDFPKISDTEANEGIAWLTDLPGSDTGEARLTAEQVNSENAEALSRYVRTLVEKGQYKTLNEDITLIVESLKDDPEKQREAYTRIAAYGLGLKDNSTPNSAAELYREAGYVRPIPTLPGDPKKPLLAGVTGRRGGTVEEQNNTAREFWEKNTNEKVNVALVMAVDSDDFEIISIDIDHHDGKTGRDEIEQLFDEYGDLGLDEEVRSTRRGCGDRGGQWFFKVPKGLRWASQVPGTTSVDIRSLGVSYSSVWPSVKDGDQYEFWKGSDPAGVPAVDKLPELPEKWVELLEKGAAPEHREVGEIDGPEEAYEILDGLTVNFNGDPDPQLMRSAEKAADVFDADGYNTMRDEVWHLVRWSVFDEPREGLKAVLVFLGEKYVEKVSGRRNSAVAGEEFARSVADAVARVADEVANGAEPVKNREVPKAPDFDELADNIGVPEEYREKVAAEAEKRVVSRYTDMIERERDGLAYADPYSSDIGDLLAMEFEDTKWIVDGLIEDGQQILVYSAGKQGKSAWVQELLSALSTGTPFLGEYETTAPKGNVGLVDVELPVRKLQERLGAREWENNLKLYPLRGLMPGQDRMMKLDLSDERSRRQWVKKWVADEIEYLVVDPLSALIREAGLNEWHEAGLALRHLQTMAAEAGIRACVVVTHASSKKDGMDNGPRGDSAMMDVPDNVWKLTNDREADTMTLETIGRTESKKIVANWEPGARFSFEEEKGRDNPVPKQKPRTLEEELGSQLSRLVHRTYDHALLKLEAESPEQVEDIGPQLNSEAMRVKHAHLFPSKSEMVQMIQSTLTVKVGDNRARELADWLVHRGHFSAHKPSRALCFVPHLDPETVRFDRLPEPQRR